MQNYQKQETCGDVFPCDYTIVWGYLASLGYEEVFIKGLQNVHSPETSYTAKFIKNEYPAIEIPRIVFDEAKLSELFEPAGISMEHFIEWRKVDGKIMG